ncbi:MAG TPA: MBL fold metallo-hydrolase [Bacteroidales bacterium]|nr:MBL fold metallo-hydrolase [Bacteroidales bacterium]HPS17224.1 MBL fold metallo-hydrolase [Bacteroidales bacterium]
MKITFLGTGTSQGVPVITCKCNVCQSDNPKDKRLRSSIMIETEKNVLVIDAGPDFRQQMLRANVQKLDGLLITHGHKDHIGGLDDVRAFNFFMKKPVDVYAKKDVHKILRSDFFYAFEDDKYPGVPEIELHYISNLPFQINGDEIIPIEVMHYKLPVLGFRIKDFTYITDANFISESELEKIKGSKILVINALRRRKHISHYTLDEALELIAHIQPEKAYLTHISHQMGLHNDIENELPVHIKPAFDGLSIIC